MKKKIEVKCLVDTHLRISHIDFPLPIPPFRLRLWESEGRSISRIDPCLCRVQSINRPLSAYGEQQEGFPLHPAIDFTLTSKGKGPKLLETLFSQTRFWRRKDEKKEAVLPRTNPETR